MITEQPILRLTVQIAATTDKNRFVTATGAAPTADGNALGPLYTDAKANEHVAVTALGVVPAVAGAAIAAGAKLKVAANGKVLTHSGNAVVVARALTAWRPLTMNCRS